jgi:hypothetical protein
MSFSTVTLGKHASKHQDGGIDEINVQGLSGLLADNQKVKETTGSYTGDASANRAIPHGLGSAPKLIFVYHLTATARYVYMYMPATSDWPEFDNGSYETPIAPDATNFYVKGNMNTSSHTYYWCAVA